MRQEIVIGVDGGASKTRAISQTLFGDTIGKGEAGEGNIHQNLEQAYQSVLEAINRSLAPINVELGDPKYQFHIGLGLAGSEVSVCKEAFLKKKLPCKSLIVESDAHVACMIRLEQEEIEAQRKEDELFFQQTIDYFGL